MIEIVNDGPTLTRTSYWRTPHARRGLLYLSTNAGTLRLLVPPPVEHLLRDLPSVGAPVLITRSAYQGRDTYVLEWAEPPGSQLDPYSVDIDQRQSDRRWPTAEDGRIVPLVWYTQIGVWGVLERRREQIQLGEIEAS